MEKRLSKYNWNELQINRDTSCYCNRTIFQFKESKYFKKKNSDYLLEGLREFNEILVPQKIEKNTEYYPYILKFLWKGNHIIKKEVLIKKLNSLGIPFTGGYGRMMHENPIFSQLVAYKNNCPYFCSKNIKIKEIWF